MYRYIERYLYWWGIPRTNSSARILMAAECAIRYISSPRTGTCKDKMYSYKKKQWRPRSKKKKKREKPKPEEHEGMPQRQHCPPAKRRGDRNPEYHEEHEKDVA
jgi:hypothetical protein